MRYVFSLHRDDSVLIEFDAEPIDARRILSALNGYYSGDMVTFGYTVGPQFDGEADRQDAHRWIASLA